LSSSSNFEAESKVRTLAMGRPRREDWVAEVDGYPIACSHHPMIEALLFSAVAVSATPVQEVRRNVVIPPPFRGVWWDTLQHCQDELSDTHLRITQDRLTFYESSGSATATRMRRAGEVVITATMEEERERWTQKFVFLLSEDGGTLTDISDPMKPFVRVRCAVAAKHDPR